MNSIRIIAWAAAMASLFAVSSAQNTDAAPPTSGNQRAPVVLGNLDALGEVIRGPLDVQTPTGHTRLLGTAHGWGSFWVSGSGSSVGPFFIHEFDVHGTLWSSTQQNTPASETQWGMRDLEVDEALGKLWGGWEGQKLAEYDFAPRPVPPNHNDPPPLTYNTTYTITGVAASTIRALARNPCNGGSFFTVDLNSDMDEFTIDSIGNVTIVDTWPNPVPAAYGAGWDPYNRHLWFFSQTSQTGCGAVQFTAIDSNTGMPPVPPLSFCGDTATGGTAGGASTYVDSFNNRGDLSIVALHQTVPRSIVSYDLNIPLAGCADVLIYCTAKATSTGCVPSIGSRGTAKKFPPLGDPGFDITLANTRPNKFYIFFYSINTARSSTIFQGGFLCTVPPIRRTSLVRTTGTVSNPSANPPIPERCDGFAKTDFRAVIVSSAHPIMQFDQIRGQWWGRDSDGNSSLSDAIEFTVN